MTETTHPVQPVKKNKTRVVAAIMIGLLVLLSALIVYVLNSKNPSIKKIIFNRRVSHDVFKITSSSPTEIEENFPVVGQPTFVFSQPLNIQENELKEYFKLSPAVEGQWHFTNNKKVVFFSSDKKRKDALVQTFPYDEVFTIGIQKELRSESGKTIKAGQTFTFHTQKDPRFLITSMNKLLNTYPDRPIQIKFTGDTENVSVKVHIRKASLDDLTNYFVSVDEYTHLYKATNTLQYSEISAFDGVIESGTNSEKLLNIPSMKPGLYYVSIVNEFGKDDLFINVATHINQIFKSQDLTKVWVTDLDGKSLGTVQVISYDLHKGIKKLNQKETDSNGLAETTNNANFIITKREDDIAVTAVSTSSYDWHSRFKVFSYSDRPVYRPGDIVHYKAVVRARNDGNYETVNQPLYVNYSADGVNYNKDYKELKPDDNGTVTTDITLSSNSYDTYPTITLYQKNGEEYRPVDTLVLKVESYRKPDLDISVETSEIEYVSSDSATMTITAKTLYGSPMTNMKFMYRVIANDYSEIENRTLENIAEYAGSYYGGGTELVNGEGTFDKKGKAKITFSTDLKDLEMSQIITVEISPKISASPSISTLAKLVHRGTFAIFYKDVKSTTKVGITGKILTMNHEIKRQPVADKELTIALYKKDINYENVFITYQKVKTDSQGSAEFKFSDVSKGDYELVAKGTDERGNVVTDRYSAYVGLEQVSETIKSKRFDLSLNSRRMNAGDSTNGLTVSADFDVKDMVIAINTVSEPKNVSTTKTRSFSVKQVNTNTFSMPINLDPGIELPISVQAFTVNQGVVYSTSAAVEMNTENRQITTNILFDKKETKPGETVKVTIENKDAQGKPISADNSLAFIDSAILQIGRIGGNMYETFFKDLHASYVSHNDSTVGIERYPAGGGGGCFLEGTPIKTPTGTKNIETVEVGDTIITRTSELNAKLTEDRVTKTFKHIVNEYLTINNTLNVTPVHRIFVNNQWITAGKVQLGDMLLNEYGEYVEITSITQHTGQFTVYNLTTQNTHTFIADGFYVHNEKGEGPRQNFADTVYWNPHIQTDSSGKATVEIKIPDNMTTYTAQVYTNKGSQFGQNAKEIVSKKDFVIIPVAANYYFTGDKATISALVQNGSDKTVSGKLLLKIPELNLTTEKDVTIAKDDFESVVYKIDLADAQKQISIQFDFKESGGNTLDSVLIRKPILAKSNMVAQWEGFTGSHNIDFNPPYPQTDLNTLELTVQPHIAQGLYTPSFMSNYYAYTRSRFDMYDGIRLYAGSYILAHTDSGEIPADIYPYAQLKNNVRQTVDSILRNKESVPQKNTFLWQPESYSNHSSGAVTLAIIKGLEEALKSGQFDEVTNLAEIISQAKNIRSQSQFFYNGTMDEAVLKRWVFAANEPCEDVACFAASALAGDRKALQKLKQSAIQTASDRLIWDSTIQNYSALPALSMIEKGSKEDADKALIGLRASNQYTDDSFTLLAGIMHAINNNLPFEKAHFKIKVNGTDTFDSNVRDDFSSYQQLFSTKNVSGGKLHIDIEQISGLPVYGIASSIQYGGSTDKKSAALKLKKDIKRIFHEIPSGKIVTDIAGGESAIVELRVANDYESNNDSYSAHKRFYLMDVLSPNFMVLNQTSGNSTQIDSIFNRLYSVGQGFTSQHSVMQAYSDQFVSFDSSTRYPNIILPYVVWNISDGNYYQPQPSLIYPLLGVIIEDK